MYSATIDMMNYGALNRRPCRVQERQHKWRLIIWSTYVLVVRTFIHDLASFAKFGFLFPPLYRPSVHPPLDLLHSKVFVFPSERDVPPRRQQFLKNAENGGSHLTQLRGLSLWLTKSSKNKANDTINSAPCYQEAQFQRLDIYPLSKNNGSYVK